MILHKAPGVDRMKGATLKSTDTGPVLKAFWFGCPPHTVSYKSTAGNLKSLRSHIYYIVFS